MGRVVTQKQVTGSTTYGLSYTYNYAGLLTGETYPSTRAMSYSYDEGGRLSSVVGDGTITFAGSFAYAAHGGLTSETWGNTAVHAMSYNRRLQASQAKVSITNGSTTVLQQYDYGYGQFNTSTGAVDTSKNNGQIGNITGTISGTTQWLQGFQYDELGRLSNVAEYQSANMNSPTYSQGYSYDRYGNRAQNANSTLGLPAVSSSDYGSSTNRFGSGLATYDNAGNITTDSKFRSLTYTYDANGRQTSASNGSWAETQTYDCAGQRVQTSVYSVTRTMVYDIFGQMVADYSGSNLESENIYRGGQLLARYDAGSWKYVMQDEKGSTRAVMNNSGNGSSVIARHDYLPFGEEIAAGNGLRTGGQGFGGTDYNRQKYAMTERDDATGLDHTWFRKYESFSGRWTSPDPLGGSISDPQSFNQYAYVQNDPVNFVDPTGLLMICTWVNGDNFEPGGRQEWNCHNVPDDWYNGPKDPPIPDPPDPPPQKATPEMPAIQTALAKCLGSVFQDLNGNAAVALVSFNPSSKGQGGSVTVNVLDRSAPGRQGIYKVRNNVTKYSSKTLPRGSRGAMGFTNSKSPYLNFTISDRDKQDSFDPGLQKIVGGFISTQIHELGNSIESASGKYGGNAFAADTDSGYQLQLCVEKELRSQGYNGG